MFLTHKEPVQKSHLLMKPTTLGALRARATIVHSLLKDVFCHYFALLCHRRGWKAAYETLLTFIFYSVIILGWHSFFLGWQLPPRATPVDPPLPLSTCFQNSLAPLLSSQRFCSYFAYKFKWQMSFFFFSATLFLLCWQQNVKRILYFDKTNKNNK